MERSVQRPATAPTVSVVMNCLNCAQYVREAIDSVYAQTFRDWEIIFWDNASTDASAEVSREYDARLRYFRGDQTVPLGCARNLAVRRAQGKFLAFLDCDDVWLPDKLERQLPLFQNPRVGLVYSNAIYVHEQSGRSRLLYRNGRAPRGNVFAKLLAEYFLALVTVVLRRRVLDGLHEWFDDRFTVVEEADLFIRIARDWDVDYVPAPLAKWRMHEQSWTWTNAHLQAEELRLMVAKYERLYPDLWTRYPREVRRLGARIAYYDALEAWKGGSGRQARERMRPHLRAIPRLLVPYAFSFFPFGIYQGLLRSLMRVA